MTTSCSARSPHRLPALRCFLVATLAACGSVADQPSLPDAGSQAPADGNVPPPPDGGKPAARCDRTRPFGAPTPVAGVNTADDEVSFALTRDERTGFLTRVVQGTAPSATILTTRRAGLGDPFGTPSADATSLLNDVAGDESRPFPSKDGLTLYFNRSISAGDPQLITAARASASEPFRSETAVRLDQSALYGGSPVLSSDGETLYWVDSSSTLHSARRVSGASDFLIQVDLSMEEVVSPVISSDEFTVYYTDTGANDIRVATRESTTEAFGAGTVLPGVSAAVGDAPVFLTFDDCVLYFKSNRPGGLGGDDLWQAQRPR